MKKYNTVLQKTALFQDILSQDIEKILQCFQSKMKQYQKDETILFIGDAITSIGIVLEGSIQIVKESIHGDKTIVAELSQSDNFAETFVCAGIKNSPVSVISVTDSTILYVDYQKIITGCGNTCGFHTKLIENMLKLIANKNLFINQKMEFLSCRSIRQKLISYLEFEAKKHQSSKFTIPFSRQELADFLCIDRSAMSRELCNMRDDKLISFQKDQFQVLF